MRYEYIYVLTFSVNYYWTDKQNDHEIYIIRQTKTVNDDIYASVLQ